MSTEIKDAIEVLTEAMQDTDLGSYAHTWHCNIAMSVYDSLTTDISHADAHRIANESAARFMKLLFGVDTKNA